MDCSNARLFLQLSRPGARDLDGPEAAELDAHLAHCAVCHHLAMDQDRLDHRLGKAMQAVEVPRGLKDQILQRLAAERGEVHRRWVAHALRGVAVAAALVLVVWGWRMFYAPKLPVISGDQVVRDFNIVRPDLDGANAQLRQLGGKACAPAFVNYAFLSGAPSLAVLPGTEEWKSPVRAAQFVFAYEKERAAVYAVPRHAYQIELDNADPGYTYRLELIDDTTNPSYVYLVLHTGKNCDWLKLAPVE